MQAAGVTALENIYMDKVPKKVTFKCENKYRKIWIHTNKKQKNLVIFTFI